MSNAFILQLFHHQVHHFWGQKFISLTFSNNTTTTTTIKTKTNVQNEMQHKRAKFQNKLNQVQLYSLVNITRVQIKIEFRIRYYY